MQNYHFLPGTYTLRGMDASHTNLTAIFIHAESGEKVEVPALKLARLSGNEKVSESLRNQARFALEYLEEAQLIVPGRGL